MPLNLGFIITRSPDESSTDSLVLKAASQALRKGDQVTIFLLGDAVWLAVKSKSDIKSFIKKGGKLVVSGEHLKAHGLSTDELLPSVEVASDPYDGLVDLVMEKCDKVVMI